MNFWRKCGKLIANGTTLIRCDYNPCGYYVLLAIVSREYDGDNGNINYCSQPQIEVIPFMITQGCIHYKNRDIKISQTPDEKGRVGTSKKCGTTWQECSEWDEQGNCVKESTYYSQCYQIDVYRIGGCYDDYETFAQHVYSKCTQITAPFPNVFNSDGSVTWDANNCIYKNRDVNNDDSWYVYAYWSYVPRIKLKVDNLYLNVRIQMNQDSWYIKTDKIYWCDGDCLQYDDKGNCTNCNGTLYEQEITLEQGIDGYFHGYYKGHQLSDPLISRSDFQDICTPQEEWQLDYCYCQNKYNAASLKASSQILNLATTYPNSRSNYNHSYSEENVICKSGEYSSWAGPGGCGFGYDMYNEYKQSYGARDLYFLKPDKMQGNSTGVQVYVKVMKYQGTDNRANYHCINNGTETVFDGVFTYNWGQKLQLPIANNMVNGMKSVQGYCNSWEDSMRVAYQPTDGYRGYCSNPCKITWYVEVRKLIF